MKVKYVGPGVKEGFFATTDLTIGKEYEAVWDEEDKRLVHLKDDAGVMILRVVKGRFVCPFDEYFEVVEE